MSVVFSSLFSLIRFASNFLLLPFCIPASFCLKFNISLWLLAYFIIAFRIAGFFLFGIAYFVIQKPQVC